MDKESYFSWLRGEHAGGQNRVLVPGRSKKSLKRAWFQKKKSQSRATTAQEVQVGYVEPVELLA
jgi:hypothetical protein